MRSHSKIDTSRTLIITIFGVIPWVILSDGELAAELLEAHGGLLITSGLVVIAWFGTIWSRRDPYQSIRIFLQSSSLAFGLVVFRSAMLIAVDESCSRLCFGLLNRLLGIACGLAAEGCLLEFFLACFATSAVLLSVRAKLGTVRNAVSN